MDIMKNPEMAINDKGNIFCVPGRMTRREAEEYWPKNCTKYDDCDCDWCHHQKIELDEWKEYIADDVPPGSIPCGVVKNDH